MEKIMSLGEWIPQSAYQKMVFSLLKRFKRGQLTLTMPNGEQFQFGEGQGTQAIIKLNHLSFFQKIVLAGDVGLGESYSDGDWDTPDLTAVIKWAIGNVDHSGVMSGSVDKAIQVNLINSINRLGHFLNRNNKEGSKKNIQFHYDLSNDFYQLMLDPSMSYSCGIFTDSNTTLEQAQELKLSKICQDLDLQKDDHVLEIGCGWGGFAEFAVKHYGCRVTGITISQQQFAYATERMKRAGIQDRVNIEMKDYRDLTGQYDKIVSIEMIEAVGHEYLPTFFQKCHELLKPEGLLVMQAITSPDSRYDSFRTGVDWIQKHIFPGSLLPSVGALNQAALKTSTFHLFNLRDIGLHYATTLRLWRENVHHHLAQVRALGMDQEFLRKWDYYLSYCEAAFATRNISDVQLTYIRPNNTKVHL